MSLNTYDELSINTTPELVFGLVGPIGVDIAEVQNKLRDALTAVKYLPVEIRATDLMREIKTDVSIVDDRGPLEYYTSRMDYANAVRKKCADNSALAALSILAIKNFRSQTHSKNKPRPIDESKISPLDTPLPSTAYIIRQFKTKEEIILMRAVYGKKFIQISVHASDESRINKIVNDINLRTAGVSADDVEDIARALIKRDENEKDEVNGQRLGKIFHLGDVFVDGTSEVSITKTVTRFINAFFGKNSTSPSRDEYGSYIAASAALRSLDTSRQVGAAIFSKNGEIITMGSNEVPKFGGGTYWEDDDNPHRDFDDKRMPNYVRKNRMFHDILSKLRGAGYLKIEALPDKEKTNDSAEQQDPLTEIMNDEVFDQALINDITEFGRMTHAEMNAITDAARMGRSLKNSTLFGTTFPCHNCAKHIVASGIDRVVFIEPYPKSQALPLNGDSITLDSKDQNKVAFCNFVGISPMRYRDIFEKGKRKSQSGRFKEWYEDAPRPRVLDRGAGYVLNESSAILRSLSKVEDEIVIRENPKDDN